MNIYLPVGPAVSRLSYAGPCPEGHEAVWTDTLHLTRADYSPVRSTFECRICNARSRQA